MTPWSMRCSYARCGHAAGLRVLGLQTQLSAAELGLFAALAKGPLALEDIRAQVTRTDKAGGRQAEEGKRSVLSDQEAHCQKTVGFPQAHRRVAEGPADDGRFDRKRGSVRESSVS
jgi:hypothetical protein